MQSIFYSALAGYQHLSELERLLSASETERTEPFLDAQLPLELEHYPPLFSTTIHISFIVIIIHGHATCTEEEEIEEESYDWAYLGAVDFVVGKKLRILERSIRIADQQLPYFFTSFINNWPGTKIQLPDRTRRHSLLCSFLAKNIIVRSTLYHNRPSIRVSTRLQEYISSIDTLIDHSIPLSARKGILDMSNYAAASSSTCGDWSTLYSLAMLDHDE